MTNLEYLEKFITATYGAICFHNDPEDGYVELSNGLKMETLAIYFANEIDLYDVDRKERLTKTAGEKFYERYVGARGKKLCTLNGCVILARYERDGNTCDIHLHFPLILGGGVMDIINYFAGNDIDGRTLELPNNVNMPVPTNNNFRLDTGDDIKTVLENYLLKSCLPLISEENGFFVKHENVNYKAEWVGQSIASVQEIQSKRQHSLIQAFKFLTEADWQVYNEEMGIDWCESNRDDDCAPVVLTNLQAAEKFFTEVFGAICFYDDPEDGYVELEGNRKIETLAIYFANKLNYQIEDRKERLTKAVGEKLYERYDGANGNTVCGLHGSFTLVAYYVGEKPVAIVPYGRSELVGGVSFVVDYFCGRNINSFTADLRYFTKDLQTNCGIIIKKGMPIMDIVDKFLLKKRIEPLRAGFNFMLPKELGISFYYDTKRKAMNLFGAVAENISQIADARKKVFEQELFKVTKQD